MVPVRKPRSYRGVVLALGLALICWSGQAQEQQPDTHGDNQATQETTADAPRTGFPVQLIESPAEAEARQRAEQEAERRDIDDLAAQQGMNAATQAMNDATQRMAQYALWSTLIIGVGTALLFWTLWETRRANRSANHSVSVTREMFERQLRSYISIVPLVKQPMFLMKQDEIIVFIGFKNVGATPASDVVFNGVIYVQRGTDILAFSEIIDEHGGMAPQGDAAIVGKIAATQANREAWGNCNLFVQGRFFYKNGFGKLGITGYSMWVEIVNGHTQDTSQYTKSGNELS